MIICGLDIAAKTGVVVLSGETILHRGVIQVKKSDDHRFRRWNDYANQVTTLCANADLVVIEDYALGFRGAVMALMEQGSVIRNKLWEQGLQFIELSPKTLKKFIAGTGNATKEDMISSIARKWGFTAKDDNEADAYGLARLGQALYSQRTPEELMSVKEKYPKLF